MSIQHSKQDACIDTNNGMLVATATTPAKDQQQQQLDFDENDFEGKLLHQACLWDNSDLLEDLLFGGDEVSKNFVVFLFVDG